MKLISTRVHGMLDYGTVGMLLLLPRVLRWRRTVRQLVTGAALGTLAYSAVTRYEWGLIKVLPMKAHLALDGVNGLLFSLAPILLQEEDLDVAGGLVGIGLFEISAALLTDDRPEAEKPWYRRARTKLVRSALAVTLVRKLLD